ncbi:MAG TPA: MFS transporter [Acidobacteriota bacterium]|nr:MFS transporter [Acidobacteriota bacterium]
MFGNRVFFGWWVLFGIFASYTALCGIQIYTLPLFYPELMREFGWSAEKVTRAATVFFITGAIITPFVSSLFDKFSTRIFMIAGALLTIGGLFSYSHLHTLMQMTIIYMTFSLSQVCAGQVPTMLTVTRWFNRYRGIAVGITLMGPDVGGAIFPLVVKYVLARGNWRDALHVLMFIAGAMMLLPLIFLIRSRPEDKGLLPDGETLKTKTAEPTAQQPVHAGITLKEALRMPALYILAFATGSLWYCMNGIVQHQTIFMSSELRITMDTLPVIVSAIFWFAIVGKLLIGYLSDHFDKIAIMFIVVIILTAGLTILRFSSANNLFGLFCYAAVFGIGYSGTFTMIQLVIAEFYSGQSYGKILGILTSVDVGAGGIAITAIALMHDAFKSYLPVFEMLIGLTSVVAILVLSLFKFRRNILHRAMPPTS